jgi:outer membrane protein
MSRFSRIVMLAAAALGVAAAQTKVGIVNSQKAMVDTAELKKAQLDMEAKYKPRIDQMTAIQKDLAALQAQLQSGKLNPQQQQDATVQGQRKERDLQRIQQDVQEEQDRDRNDILGRILGRMREIVSKLAEAKGLDVVIDAANTFYFKPALDLTADATAAYDKAYPAAPPGK